MIDMREATEVLDQPQEPPTLFPVVHIALQTQADGSYANPAIEFDAGHSLVYIRQNTEGTGLWSWVCWHAPTFAAATLLVVLAFLAFKGGRVFRRPQSFGHFYCRRCNYDLTAPGGMPPQSTGQTRCPECGTELVSREVRLGRSRWGRVWKVLAFGAVALLGSLLVMAVTLEPFVPGTGTTPWLDSMTRYVPLARLQRHRSWTFGAAPDRVTAWSLPEGRMQRQFAAAIEGCNETGLSPDGRWFVATLQRPGTPYLAGDVLVRDLEHATERNVRLDGPLGSQLLFAGFSEDGRRAYIHSIEQPSPAFSAGFRASLREIDLETCTTRVITSVTAAYNGNVTPGQRFAVREVKGALVWALLMDRGAGASASGPTVKAEVVTSNGQNFAFEFAGPSWFLPRLSNDGNTLDISANGSPTTAHLNLATGAVVQTPGSTGDPSGGGRTLRFATPPRSIRGIVNVVNAEGAIEAKLDGGAAGGPWSVVISRDGRWAAGIVHTATTWPMASSGYRPEVVVWDLSSLPNHTAREPSRRPDGSP
jgi:hypothetical protein